MSQTHIQTLLLMMDSSDNTSYHTIEFADWPIEDLRRRAIIQDSGYASEVMCIDCHESHAVQFHPPQNGRSRVSFYDCPEAGRIKIDESNLRTFSINPASFAAFIASELRPHGSPSETVPERLWFVGLVGGRTIYLARGAGWADAGNVFAPNAIANATVLTISPTPPNPLPANVQLIPVSEILSIINGTLTLDRDALMPPIPAVAVPIEPLVFAENFRRVTRTRDDRDFRLSKLQSHVVLALLAKLNQGITHVPADVLLEGSNSGSSISDIFRKSDAWSELVQGDRNGLYHLNL